MYLGAKKRYINTLSFPFLSFLLGPAEVEGRGSVSGFNPMQRLRHFEDPPRLRHTSSVTSRIPPRGGGPGITRASGTISDVINQSPRPARAARYYIRRHCARGNVCRLAAASGNSAASRGQI